MLLKNSNKLLKYNGSLLNGIIDPYNPLNLPPYTIRLKFLDGVMPTFSKGTGVQVSSSPNIWDLTYENSDWNNLLLYCHDDLLEVLGANTSGVTSMSSLFAACHSLTIIPLFDTSSVTNMYSMFYDCRNLTNVPLFDTSNVNSMYAMFFNCKLLVTIPLFNTSNVTNMRQMFNYCESLTNVPLFDTSSVTDAISMFSGCKSLTLIPLFNTNKIIYVSGMFAGCYNVESGALALYNQMSTQINPPIEYNRTFYYCGYLSETGSAELAQIPDDWK